MLLSRGRGLDRSRRGWLIGPGALVDKVKRKKERLREDWLIGTGALVDEPVRTGGQVRV